MSSQIEKSRKFHNLAETRYHTRVETSERQFRIGNVLIIQTYKMSTNAKKRHNGQFGIFAVLHDNQFE